MRGLAPRSSGSSGMGSWRDDSARAETRSLRRRVQTARHGSNAVRPSTMDRAARWDTKPRMGTGIGRSEPPEARADGAVEGWSGLGPGGPSKLQEFAVHGKN